MYTLEVRRIIYLAEEGLLCRGCHKEVVDIYELAVGRCAPCVALERKLDRWYAKQSRKRVNDITRGQGAELVLDMVGVNPTLAMATQMSRMLGHLTIVGIGGGALPVNFSSPRNECSVSSPFWGSIPELVEVITLAQTGKIKMMVEHYPLERAGEVYHLLHKGKIQGRAVITPNG